MSDPATALDDRNERIQAQKLQALGALVAGIAHDFNNILTAIVGYSQLAHDAMAVDSRERADLGQVLVASERGVQLIDRLLTFTRRGGDDSGAVPVDVASEVRECLDIMRAAMPATVELRSEIDPDCGRTPVVPGQVQQIIMNLCTNASQAMSSSGGVLEVSATAVVIDGVSSHTSGELASGRYVKLVVTDSGPGIDPHLVGRIFEPFFTTKKATGGSGIGLGVVSEIVAELGGGIDVESRTGAGATFAVYLPRSYALESPGAHEPATPQRAKSNQHVLVVDDELPITSLARRQLENLGYCVSTTVSGREAMRILTNQKDIALVLADITMPDVTGLMIAVKLSESNRSPPVVLMSGYKQAAVDQVRRSGAVGFVKKPFTLVELSEAVSKALNKSTANGTSTPTARIADTEPSSPKTRP